MASPRLIAALCALATALPAWAAEPDSLSKQCAKLVARRDEGQEEYERRSMDHALAVTVAWERQQSLPALKWHEILLSREKRQARAAAEAALAEARAAVDATANALQEARDGLRAAAFNLDSQEAVMDLHISPEIRTLLNVTTLPLTITRDAAEIQAIHDALMAHADTFSPRPVAAASVIIRDRIGLVLVARRKGSRGAGDWAFPGGKLEPGEDLLQTAIRETSEEADVVIDDLRLVGVTFDAFPAAGTAFFNFIFEARIASGNPRVMEPQKLVSKWEWRRWDRIPEPRFEADRQLRAMGYTGPAVAPSRR